MKRISFVLIFFTACLFSKFTAAQQPNCSGHYFFPKYDIDTKYFAFGNYAKSSSDDTCRLMSGEGIHLSFSFAKTGNSVTFEKKKYGQVAESILFIDTLPTYDIPDWALDLVNTNREMMRQYVPGRLAEIEIRAAAKQKILDDEKSAVDKLSQEKRQAQDAADLAKLRADIAKMNAGQLFAKADELSSSGDSAKAREVLRSLVSRFPDHPLAAQAAAQMAGGSSGVSSSANNAGGNGQRASSAQKSMTCREITDELGNDFILFFAPTNAAGKMSDADKLVQYVYVSKKLQQLVSQHPACRDNPYSKTITSSLESWQSQCRSARGSDCVNGRDSVGYDAQADKIIARLLSMPAATNNAGDLQAQSCESAIAKQELDFQAVMRKPVPEGATPPLMRVMWATSEKIKLIRANCPNTAAYQSQIRDLQSVYDQSDKACGQMMAGNTCPGPNPYR
ncbi:MAG: hypothetical protein RLY95_1240 [Pseudomonadota bacterium]|jgi:hypothetical protein